MTTNWGSQPIRRGQSSPLTPRTMERAFQRARLEQHRRVGGHAAFPPTVAIERQPFRWDTNGFYRRLGLATTATRLDIVRAFLALDPRQDFLHLAVAAEVLLSKAKRPRYDALPLGTFWAEDPALTQAKMSSALAGVSVDEWGVYADGTVTDEQAQRLSPLWRGLLATALGAVIGDLHPLPFVGVGATTEAQRWAQVGYFAILFVPLDEEPSLEYVRAAAVKLMEIATPMRAWESK